jgi:hypothetical protein
VAGRGAEAERCAVMAMRDFPPKGALWCAAASRQVRLGMGDRLSELPEELCAQRLLEKPTGATLAHVPTLQAACRAMRGAQDAR